MRVGVPKEIKIQEHRVGLTPMAVREYTAAGHEVLVQAGAGAGIGAADAAYEAAGARIVATAAEVFAAADMVVKVKEPQPAEWKNLRPGQILFTYLHLAPDPEQARGLIDSGCIAVAYETVTDAHGGLPLLAPMSEVAGRLAIEAAAFALRKPAGGKGLLLGGVPGAGWSTSRWWATRCCCATNCPRPNCWRTSGASGPSCPKTCRWAASTPTTSSWNARR